ncbi:hypothetical protein [Planococcus shixiaomingii]|uniref:hypothetical protein n=1 Tax=Planococcus shixiaomingii TaxID=3058393 RepID=UPI0026152250|nr:hypothetical protein [Planococcus sp. N022]WKA56561.1 hypothetical protein QWY21_09505 [Planococcus sp. N022]
MRCFCEKQETNELKLEGDIDTDPLWCIHCGCNLEVEELPLSRELQEELARWAAAYGDWVDWEKDQLLPNGHLLEDEHNKAGLSLTEKLKKELNNDYKIEFSPFLMANNYPA